MADDRKDDGKADPDNIYVEKGRKIFNKATGLEPGGEENGIIISIEKEENKNKKLTEEEIKRLKENIINKKAELKRAIARGDVYEIEKLANELLNLALEAAGYESLLDISISDIIGIIKDAKQKIDQPLDKNLILLEQHEEFKEWDKARIPSRRDK